MSLFIRIGVGHNMLNTVRVSRVSNTDDAVLDPDTVSTYQIDQFGPGHAFPFITDGAMVEHRYGDGATELARLALNALTTKENT